LIEVVVPIAIGMVVLVGRLECWLAWLRYLHGDPQILRIKVQTKNFIGHELKNWKNCQDA